MAVSSLPANSSIGMREVGDVPVGWGVNTYRESLYVGIGVTGLIPYYNAISKMSTPLGHACYELALDIFDARLGPDHRHTYTVRDNIYVHPDPEHRCIETYCL